MTTHRFSGRTTETYVIAAELADDTWRFTAKSRIDASVGPGIEIKAQDTRIIIEGRVEAGAGQYAIDSRELNTSITLNKGAETNGIIGCYEDYASIVNRGTIDQNAHGYAAIQFIGDFATLHNYGTIGGTVEAVYNAAQIFNEKTGVIHGQIALGSPTDAGYVENHGRIIGSLFSNDSNDVIVNDGTIQGNVGLNGGKDVFDNRGGRVIGAIYGGAGDDVYYFSNAKDLAQESDGGGEDIVKSTVSYRLNPMTMIERLELIGKKDINGTGTGAGERLYGNSGDNVLTGKGGIDYFDGKAGDDLLKGTTGVESRFFFRTGYDHDTIQHLDHGIDAVYLSDWNAIDDFADLLSHARNRGDDVVIAAGRDSLTIMDMHKADLQADDFTFLA